MKEVCTNAPFASICTIKRQNGFHHYSMGSVFFCLYPYQLSFFLLESTVQDIYNRHGQCHYSNKALSHCHTLSSMKIKFDFVFIYN